MSLMAIAGYDGGLIRKMQSGDTLVNNRTPIPATIATNAITITGLQLASSFIQRTPTGAATDTIDTAANIVGTLSAGLGLTGIDPGTCWITSWINNAAAQAITITATANTGITVTNPTVNAVSVKEVLVTVVNGTPAQTINSIACTNASAILTGMTAAQTATLSVGMIVTNAVGGLQGAKIISVQPGTGVTMDTNATSTATISPTFSPVITLVGIGQKLI